MAIPYRLNFSDITQYYPVLICFLSTVLCYDKPNKSKKSHKHSIYYRKLNCLLGFQIQNHIQIIEGSDNGISDN